MLELQSVFPNALRERLSNGQSAIWSKQVSFPLGSFIGLTAPSGTGKTTLIHFLYALRQDYSGTILYNTKNILHYSQEELAEIRRNEISVVFQDLRLFPQLTIKENIQLKMCLGNRQLNETNIVDMAKRLSIDHILNTPATICSYGEQQRAAIIRALIQPFHYLLLDEPFSHLDNNNTKKAIDLIQETCDSNKASLVIADLDVNTHFPYTQLYTL